MTYVHSGAAACAHARMPCRTVERVPARQYSSRLGSIADPQVIEQGTRPPVRPVVMAGAEKDTGAARGCKTLARFSREVPDLARKRGSVRRAHAESQSRREEGAEKEGAADRRGWRGSEE